MVFTNIYSQHSDGEVDVTVKPEQPPQSVHSSIASIALSSPHQSQTGPTVQKHYYPRTPQCPLAQHLYVAPPHQAGMRRRNVLGLGGAARSNVVWQPDTGKVVTNMEENGANLVYCLCLCVVV